MNSLLKCSIKPRLPFPRNPSLQLLDNQPAHLADIQGHDFSRLSTEGPARELGTGHGQQERAQAALAGQASLEVLHLQCEGGGACCFVATPGPVAAGLSQPAHCDPGQMIQQLVQSSQGIEPGGCIDQMGWVPY